MAVVGLNDVAGLQHDETVHLDPDKLGALYRDLGPRQTEVVLTRALEEIGQRIEALPEPYQEGRWAELARRARSLIAIADQIGMSKLARVAGDVAICAERCEAPALGACLARLDRIAQNSLAAIYDMANIGG